MKRALVLAVAVLAVAGCRPAFRKAPPLESRLGRSEVRVWSAPYPLVHGVTVRGAGIPERLDRLGYTRVRRRPAAPGEYFWGEDRVWIYRHGHRWDGRDWPPLLLCLELDGFRGEVRAVASERHRPLVRPTDGAWLEPEVLAESLDGRRAPRVPVRLADLPERVWRPVLAAEDHRFFAHRGVDARSLARAVLANLRVGGVAQGGSTLTQQLVKNRDLTPRRTVARKASEALRALDVESTHTKEEILEVYLNHVYLGQVDGLAVHGFGAAARAFFGKPAEALQVQEAATLAGLIRSPNRLSPLRHPAEAKARRDQVLARMGQLGWLSAADVAAVQARPLGLRHVAPRPPMAGSFIAWSAAVARRTAPERIARGRGVVLETTLDPLLQAEAERAVRAATARLRREHRELRRAPLGVALVALDPSDGGVVAYVGSPPGSLPGGFDRVRQGKRQPGSLVKPLVLLEAFESCGGDPLYPSSRVADEPLQLTLPTGAVWEPVDADRRFLGTVSVRAALRESRNVPFVRLARRCGFAETAERLREAGLALPSPPPPSFVLGSVEATPLQVARAYTVFATPGDAVRPRPVSRVERPGGSRLDRIWPSRTRVVSPASAYLAVDLLRDAAALGTARAAAIPGLVVAAKTGTTSEQRDAWLAGHAGGLVTVVWVGRDDGRPLGLTGSEAAAPLWRDFMRRAVPLRPPHRLERPPRVVDRYVDAETGLLVRGFNPRAMREVFREDVLPPRDRFWRIDDDVPVVR
ncbi:MAG TPA: transglycosylase domain-containing protein [Thermoanaerobaculia bacterium]|nr:transglycosylase domain-containing protein [Thermoanaerobaculia bacterium]